MAKAAKGLFKCLQKGCDRMVRGYYCEEHRPEWLQKAMALHSVEMGRAAVDTEGLLCEQAKPLRKPAVIVRGKRKATGWLSRMVEMSSTRGGLYGSGRTRGWLDTQRDESKEVAA